MQENKYLRYYWLKYNANLLKKQKYFAFNNYSFVKYALSIYKTQNSQTNASASKGNNPSISNSPE